ncbi:MAG TPA: shikimate dehydrogenase [Bacillota bacterium]|nr:shikimate dehydrogenase [Bacillota bacterium]
MDSKTVLTGIFGYPVGHSMSPLMHNAAFQALGLNYRYGAFSIPGHSLKSAVEGIRALGFRGVNVTIPHKVEVMEYLDEIDDEALQIGAVNTIVNENGKLIGYNTDGQGYVCSLLQEWETPLSGKKVVILGAGGAARAVAVSLARHGVKEMVIANRSVEKAQGLAEHVQNLVKASAISMEDLNRGKKLEVDLLINTTSVGMYPNIHNVPISLDLIHDGLMISDLIYNPLNTELLIKGKEVGAKTMNGLGMFIHQGSLAFELWTGMKPPVDLMKETVLKQLKNS